jgi:hypothetical protein
MIHVWLGHITIEVAGKEYVRIGGTFLTNDLAAVGGRNRAVITEGDAEDGSRALYNGRSQLMLQ